MSLKDQINSNYQMQTAETGPDVYKKYAEIVLEIAAEKMAEDAKRNRIADSVLYGPYVSAYIPVSENLNLPRNAIQVKDKTVYVRKRSEEGKRLFREIKKLARKEGIRAYCGVENYTLECSIKQ